jgi:MFS family permease
LEAQGGNFNSTGKVSRSYRSPKKAVLLVSSAMTILAGATIAPALPGISQAFGDTPNVGMLVALVLTAPALAIALTASFIGLAIDRFGRKPVLVAATFVYGIAGSSGLYLDSLVALIVGRFVLGISVAAMMTATSALIVDYYDGIERQAFMGAQSSAIGFSGVLFLIGGGLLAEFSWRAPFAIYLAAFLLLPAIVCVLHEPDHVAQSGHAPLTNIAQGIKLRIATAYLFAFALMVTFYILPVQLPFYLLELGGMSATHTGFAIACGTLTMAVAALFYKRLRRLFSIRSLFAVSCLFISVAFFILAHASTYSTVLVATAINGIGSGIALPNLNVWLADLAPASARGRIFGGLTTAFFLGQFLSPILTAPVIERNGLSGIFGGFGVLAICQLAICLGIAVLSLRRLRDKDNRPSGIERV